MSPDGQVEGEGGLFPQPIDRVHAPDSPSPAPGDPTADIDDILAAEPTRSPWRDGAFVPDHALLARLLTVPTARGDTSRSGRFARAVDAWAAHELRRAGFGHDEVWPRPSRPRVLPRDVALLLERLPRALADEVRRRLPDIPSVAPVDARILGRAYEKQVDVCIARWDRGPELLISTKAQTSSFGKNLPNRFEEAYGDTGNLRGRYPLAAVGFLFVQRATVLTAEPEAFERTVDMIRTLRDRGDGGYTATGLVLVDWNDDDPATTMAVREDPVPRDVASPQFFAAMIDRVLEVTPVTMHVEVRERREGRRIAVSHEARRE